MAGGKQGRQIFKAGWRFVVAMTIPVCVLSPRPHSRQSPTQRPNLSILIVRSSTSRLHRQSESPQAHTQNGGRDSKSGEPAPAPTRPMPERWRSAPRTATQPNQPARRPKAAPTRQQQLISYHRGHRADRRTSCGRRARTPQARCKHEGPAEISPHARGSHGQLRLASHSL